MSHSWVGQKCLEECVWTECSAVTFRPKKMFKTKCSGVDEQSVHLEIKCHSGRSEHLDIVLGGCSEGVKTLLGHFKHGRFIKALSQDSFGAVVISQPPSFSHCDTPATRSETVTIRPSKL
jgi:hypothetical protein